ncbi:hypothetical protein H6P81_008546 [Aristolochia fimbriata]|uniref:SET domain-containing protein n=1 Tax=Aristolochia fimbriata TaxID=158543 RepID=A0AAV7EJK7_ARIFI|nr:hypothetical protein H6P81_008546 [Aristolochia fimbriata]
MAEASKILCTSFISRFDLNPSQSRRTSWPLLISRPNRIRCSASTRVAENRKVPWGCEIDSLENASVLQKWLSESGLPPQKMRIETVEVGERGLVALKNIRKREKLLFVPPSLIITADSEWTCPEAGDVLKRNSVPDWPLLATYLISEASAGDSSRWNNYISALPRQPYSLLYWSQSELDMYLVASQIRERAIQRITDVTGTYKDLQLRIFSKYPNLFPEEIFNIDTFKWSFGILFSRLVRLPSMGEKVALVPWADMLNHNSEVETFLDYDKASEGIVFTTDKSYQPGDQVFISYGKKSSGELLLSYGFVPKEGTNPNDSAELILSLNKSDKCYGAKREALIKQGLSTSQRFPLHITGWPLELMAFAYLAVSPPNMRSYFEEMAAAASNKSNTKKDRRYPEIEEQALQFILDSCEAAISRYTKFLNEVGYLDLGATSPEQVNRKLLLRQLAVDLCTSERRILFRSQYILRRRLRDMRTGELRALKILDGFRKLFKRPLFEFIGSKISFLSLQADYDDENISGFHQQLQNGIRNSKRKPRKKRKWPYHSIPRAGEGPKGGSFYIRAWVGREGNDKSCGLYTLEIRTESVLLRISSGERRDGGWNNIPESRNRWVWYGMFGAELFFGFYWILTQAARWRPLFRYTFKERLSQRHEKELPNVDIFVCTADPAMEPPVLVINTVLSMMAYDYPPENLGVYLSDDAGSEITFYALLEASSFSKHWIPFCKKFKVEARSPAAYFSAASGSGDAFFLKQWHAVKKLYEEMECRIETTVMLGRISEEIKAEHEGFLEWNSEGNSRNHQTVLKVVLDGRHPENVDMDGTALPTLVYLAREKRPQYPHNFKAGAMNALIRVSSEITNAPIILNVDCDMYSNNPETVRDALCFFMDEEIGHEVAYVQQPQNFSNVTKNNFYHNRITILDGMEFRGADGFGGSLYIGTGCFHRRDCLCGKKYTTGYKGDFRKKPTKKALVKELEERAKVLASCTFEENTEWGKEMGLRYGCPVEDVLTGFAIQQNGWKSVYFNPTKRSFVGVAGFTLEQVLVQHKRWSEGDFQILLSRYSPFLFWKGKTNLGLRMVYSIYTFCPCTSIPTLFYAIIPSLCLYTGTTLFPKMSSPWIVPFAYAIVGNHTYAMFEALWCGETLKGWLNMLRMNMFKRTTSYLFAFIDTLLKISGFAESSFVITAKVADEDVKRRYEQEIMEFGSSSPMFLILSALALLNLISFGGGLMEVIAAKEFAAFDALGSQLLLCGSLIIIYLPVYEALFFRRDGGRLPSSVTPKSLALAVVAISLAQVRITKSMETHEFN